MVFDQLQALVEIMQNIGTERIEDFFSTPGKKESLILRFYRLLEEDISEDEEVLSKMLFGNEVNNTSYRVLKNRTKKQLLGAVLNSSISSDKYSESFKVWFRCSKEFIIAELLIKLGKRKAGIEMIIDIHKEAVKYHQTELTVRALQYLTSHYAFIGEKKKHKEAKKQLDHATNVHQAEITAIAYYEEVAILYANKHSERPENLPFAIEKLTLIKELSEKYNSYKIKDRYWTLASLVGQIDLNYEMVVQSIDDATNYLEKNPHLARKSTLGLYALEKLKICFSHRKFEEAQEAVQSCEKLLTPETGNWLGYKMMEVMLNLHVECEEEAWNNVQKVKKTLKKSSGGMDSFGSEWKILEGYCYYARMTSIPQPNRDEMSRFPNPVRVFAGGFLEFFDDKEGTNLSMLICHILLISLLPDEKTDLSNKIALLDRYRYRNLTNRQSLRGAYFIELLRAMVRADYNRKTCTRIAKPILNKMAEITIIENYEILPFEKVWERMVYRLTK